MPQEGPDLFGVMDSALKRQREAGAQKSKDQPARPPLPRMLKGEAPAPTPASPPPPASAPATSATPPPAEPPPPGEQPAGPITHSSITQRFQRPDPANAAPQPGSLKPGEVLRGTFFSGGLAAKRASGVFQPPAPPKAAEPPPPPPPPPAPAPAAPPVPVAGPTVPLRSPATSFYRPSARASAVTGIGAPAPAASPAPVPAPAPAPAPAQSAAAPAAVPVQAPSVRVGSLRVGSARLEPAAPAAPAQVHGIFVPTRWAVAAVIAIGFGAIVFYYLGYQIAARKFAISPPPGGRRVEAPPDAGKTVVPPGGLKPIPGIEGVGQRPPPPPPPPPPPKYAVKVRAFLMSDPREREQAASLLKTLRARGGAFADARIIERRSDVNSQCLVVVGRFDRADDPRAEQLRRAALALDARLRGRVEVIQE